MNENFANYESNLIKTCFGVFVVLLFNYCKTRVERYGASLLLVKLPHSKVRLEWLKLDGCFYFDNFLFIFIILTQKEWIGFSDCSLLGEASTRKGSICYSFRSYRKMKKNFFFFGYYFRFLDKFPEKTNAFNLKIYLWKYLSSTICD